MEQTEMVIKLLKEFAYREAVYLGKMYTGSPYKRDLLLFHARRIEVEYLKKLYKEGLRFKVRPEVQAKVQAYEQYSVSVWPGQGPRKKKKKENRTNSNVPPVSKHKPRIIVFED